MFTGHLLWTGSAVVKTRRWGLERRDECLIAACFRAHNCGQRALGDQVQQCLLGIFLTQSVTGVQTSLFKMPIQLPFAPLMQRSTPTRGLFFIFYFSEIQSFSESTWSSLRSPMAYLFHASADVQFRSELFSPAQLSFFDRKAVHWVFFLFFLSSPSTLASAESHHALPALVSDHLFRYVSKTKATPE